jgi:hypothetical protein
MKLLIQVLVKNNEQWVKQFKTMIDKIQCQKEIYFYENDSTDGTRDHLFGNVFSEHCSLKGTRTERLSVYRNKLKDFVKEEFDLVLLVDSNVYFSEKSFLHLLETIKDPSVAMAVPHAMVKTSLPCTFYYDTFAAKCDQFDSVLPCLHDGPYHDRHCHKVTGRKPIKEFTPMSHKLKREIEFDYCFGGFVLLKWDAFKGSKWGTKSPTDCEHWMFCDDVRRFGKIMMNTDSKVIWVE